jgi:putative addiction module killer protein
LEWLDGVAKRDKLAEAAAYARIERLGNGNFSDSETIGGGASEDKIDLGPGFRVYYGVDGDKIILLHGGDKATQKKDIKIAKDRWQDYKKREAKRREDERRELQSRSSGKAKK